MKQIIPINALWGGNVAPCVTAHYHKAGERDLYLDNAFCPHIAILEMEEVNIMVIGSMQSNAMRGSLDGVSPCLTEAMGTGGGQIPMVTIRYRIRKLTPRECFRLMGMDDADIDKIDAYRIKTTLKDGTVKEKPIPKSQKYKMAGNSIVVDVLYNIFYQMFIAEPPKPQPRQLNLFD